MPRNFTPAGRRAAQAQETGSAFFVLLVLRHPTLPAPLRFANDMADVVSSADGTGAQTYIGCPFDIILPEERSDQLPQARLSIANVDERIVQALRSISSAPSLEVYVVLSDKPSDREAGPWRLTLRTVDYDAQTITGTLSFPDTLSEPFPAHIFNPTRWPGIFGVGVTPPGFPNNQMARQGPAPVPLPPSPTTG